ncbi:MAG: iron-sulfur cluster assembly accessory protein [Oscillatoriales cyanobacterium RM2_1_1]|nr:iron-sulfur cluster assembly accessory protein [Oscillatoriales cyanobacterium SM2_3_0]NJO45447.1 iron-sulfur cluster assembly accessory protein [Oscillatoriales cyanobacterium RM2_1_1]
MTVTLTELAELRLRTFLRASKNEQNTDQQGVRLAVKDGGCNGYEYVLNLVDAPEPDDIIADAGALRLYIDRQSDPLLDGVVVEYIEGLLESGFKFTNPNATDTCGCGKSFQAGDCTPAAVPCT